MTIIDSLHLLTATQRRRLICELADQYVAEANVTRRPFTEGLPVLLPAVIAHGLHTDAALSLFDRFARCRKTIMCANSTYSQVSAAEGRAEFLLDQLVGEVAA